MISDPLLREADRCVKCGLCLPHCPTYLKLTNEADSPRGRISLIQALLGDDLGPSASLQRHLDRCLGCRACERACPSGVAFGRMIDGARARMRATGGSRAASLSPWLLQMLSDRERLSRYARILPLARRAKLLILAEKLALKRNHRQWLRVARVLPDHAAHPGLHPARHPSGRSLQLFIGCVASLADRRAINAAIAVLTRLGYAVDIPKSQVCCGALHRHNGFPDQADRLCASNRELTRNSRAEALITLATACHLELTEHAASELPVISITDFLLNLLTQTASPTAFEPLNARIAVHTPCSARTDQSVRLLKLIPDAQVFELPDNAICCGAAGSYLLTQSRLSAALGRDKKAHLDTTRADILVTSNTGCAIQFRLQGLQTEILHPIELINRQLSTG